MDVDGWGWMDDGWQCHPQSHALAKQEMVTFTDGMVAEQQLPFTDGMSGDEPNVSTCQGFHVKDPDTGALWFPNIPNLDRGSCNTTSMSSHRALYG